jgi:hypothetical protein
MHAIHAIAFHSATGCPHLTARGPPFLRHRLAAKGRGRRCARCRSAWPPARPPTRSPRRSTPLQSGRHFGWCAAVGFAPVRQLTSRHRCPSSPTPEWRRCGFGRPCPGGPQSPNAIRAFGSSLYLIERPAATGEGRSQPAALGGGHFTRRNTTYAKAKPGHVCLS